MLVNRGKRMWRIPTPLLFFFADSKGLRVKNPDPLDPPKKGSSTGNCRRAFLRIYLPHL